MSPPAGAEVATDRLTVLVVDDEVDIRFVTRLLLVDHGYAVVEAADGRAALEQLCRQPIDLVITDVDMPGMDGLTLLGHLRDSPDHRQVPVIVWSERHYDELDAEMTLTKGLGVQQLIPHVDQLLGGTP